MKNICHNFYRKIIFNASALMPVGNVGRHPFSNRRIKIEGWTFTSCVSSLCHFSTYNLHTSVKKGFIFMERAHFNKHGLSYYVISF